MAMPRLFSYVSAAFKWHWNLLAMGAGLILAVLSGRPDMVLPLLAALELGYLGVLSTHPHFRKVIDLRDRQRETVSGPDPTALMEKIADAIKPEAWHRFEVLRERCGTLDKLARQFRGGQSSVAPDVTGMQAESLERLLWMFLKLLYSRDALHRFVRTVERKSLTDEVSLSETQLASVRERQGDPKVVRSIEDKLDTLRQRLANYDQAAANLEFLDLELDRIEQKVSVISEMSLSSRDTADIAAQVDGIAAGVAATEEVMRRLDVAPVFEHEAPPRLLERETN